MPVIYPIGDLFAPGSGEPLTVNNGHRRVPAWAVPENEIPLVCSDKEWEEIRQRELEALTIKSYVPPRVAEAPLLALRNRDSSLKKGYVREVRAGAWVERRCSSMVSGGCKIRVLPGEAIDTLTGEVKRPYVRVSDCRWNGDELEFDDSDVRGMERHASRADNVRGVRESCDRFKWLVRANERLVKLFVTLTYAENMTDTKRLYEDFRRFWPRLRRNFPDVEGYLMACEPQKRGAWHVHLLLLTRKPSLYIPNKRVRSLWGRGFTKVQRVRNVRDVGAYLTSYLTNVRSGKDTKKGARLRLYPLGFRFCRWSRGVEKPEKRAFYGCFGDSFKNLFCYNLCYDYQNTSRLPSGETIVFRVSLFCYEKPK